MLQTSSSRSILGFRIRARAIAIRSRQWKRRVKMNTGLNGWIYSRFCPPDSCEPRSPTWVSKPLSRFEKEISSKVWINKIHIGRPSMNSNMLAKRHASRISSAATPSGSWTEPRRMLNLMVPLYSLWWKWRVSNQVLGRAIGAADRILRY